jgi:hypothetical protein
MRKIAYSFSAYPDAYYQQPFNSFDAQAGKFLNCLEKFPGLSENFPKASGNFTKGLKNFPNTLRDFPTGPKDFPGALENFSTTIKKSWNHIYSQFA